ncbi:hypothetical protein [Dactylosporangium sp. CS-033363]|uniref:hypothetical protein n=1 Tax=Dactylosporangium sp. CS-033363 TaxID=3239935 RepID=UPI003D935950
MSRCASGIGIPEDVAERALACGAVSGLLRLGDDLVAPTVQMARMLPHLGLVPLLIIWVGIGESLKVTLVALGAFFPVYLNTRCSACSPTSPCAPPGGGPTRAPPTHRASAPSAARFSPA